MRDGEHDPLPPALPAGVDLSDPAWWDAPGPGLEEALMAHITDAPADASAPRRPPWPRRLAVAAVGLAAAAAVFAAGYRWGTRDQPLPGVVVALVATAVQPDAAATARVEERGNGTWILLDVESLPPAPEGQYYEAWMANADRAVSAGTFHMRGGSGRVVLWTGVSPHDYPDCLITRQREGDAAISDDTVLAGNYYSDPPSEGSP